MGLLTVTCFFISLATACFPLYCHEAAENILSHRQNNEQALSFSFHDRHVYFPSLLHTVIIPTCQHWCLYLKYENRIASDGISNKKRATLAFFITHTLDSQ